MAASDTEHQPIGRVFATFDFSERAEEWLREQSEWYAENQGQAFLREFSGNWGKLLVDAFSEECERLNLPIQVEIQRTVEGSLLHIAIVLWTGAKHAWPFVQGAAETIGATATLIEAGRRVKRRLRRQANIDAHNQMQPASRPPPQVIIEVHVVIEVRPLQAPAREP